MKSGKFGSALKIEVARNLNGLIVAAALGSHARSRVLCMAGKFLGPKAGTSSADALQWTTVRPVPHRLRFRAEWDQCLCTADFVAAGSRR